MTRELTELLVGEPADGSAPSVATARAVVWVDHGDEVIVHLDSLQTRVVDGVMIVAVDLETDQTGRATVVVPMAVGHDDDGGVAVATEQHPRGPELLVRRWDGVLQEALMTGLVSLAAEHADERGGLPRALFVSGDMLAFASESDG